MNKRENLGKLNIRLTVKFVFFRRNAQCRAATQPSRPQQLGYQIRIRVMRTFCIKAYFRPPQPKAGGFLTAQISL